MRALPIGQMLPGPASVLGRSLVPLFAMLVAGCAQSGTYTPQSWNVGGPQPAMAGAVRPRVEIEPDDPSEPFSPNYGPRPTPEPAIKATL